MNAKTVAWRNTGLWPVCPAGMFARFSEFGGVELRWAHRLKVYVPRHQMFTFLSADRTIGQLSGRSNAF
jgi:hypothetical protein